jgi:MFS family permease
MQGEVLMTKEGRTVLGLAEGYTAIFGFSNVYYLLGIYLAMRGMATPAQIGWIMGAFYAAQTCCRPFAGDVVVRLGFRKTFLVGSVLCLAGSAAFALTGPSFRWLIFWRVLMGVGSGLYVVALTTYQTLGIPDSIRGSAFSLISAGGIVPLVTFVPLADFFLKKGWPLSYVWFVPLLTLYALACGLRLPEIDIPQKEGGERDLSLPALAKKPGIRVLLASVTVFSMTDACLLAIGGVASERGLLPSLFLTANATIGLLVRIGGRKILDVLPRRQMAAPAIAVTSLGLFAASFSEGNVAYALCGILFGVAMGFGFPLHMALIGDVAEPRHRAGVASLVWFLMGACFFIVPILLGSLAGLLGTAGAFRALTLALFASSFGVFLLWNPRYSFRRSH